MKVTVQKIVTATASVALMASMITPALAMMPKPGMMKAKGADKGAMMGKRMHGRPAKAKGMSQAMKDAWKAHEDAIKAAKTEYTAAMKAARDAWMHATDKKAGKTAYMAATKDARAKWLAAKKAADDAWKAAKDAEKTTKAD